MRNISCYKLFLSYVLNVSKRTFSTFFFRFPLVAFLFFITFAISINEKHDLKNRHHGTNKFKLQHYC